VRFRGTAGVTAGIAGEEAPELGKQLDEEILAAKINDDALLDLTRFAVGFHDADVFVDDAAGRADFDGSRIHDWLLASFGEGSGAALQPVSRQKRQESREKHRDLWYTSE